MIGWLWLLGCPRPVPAHLAVDTTDINGPEAVQLDTPDQTLAYILQGDPIARNPRVPPGDVPGVDPSVRAFATAIGSLEAAEEGDPRQMLGRVVSNRGTVGAALGRGYLWRRAENALAGAEKPAPRDLVPLITPLRVQESDASLSGDPLGFLQTEDSIRAYGERWVLQSWLHAPDLPIGPVQDALRAPQFTGLASSPTGRLLLARAATAVPTDSFALLERATLVHLTRAAADRDTEQAAWADLKLDLREELGVDTPETELLLQAFDALLPAAGDDDAAGAALVAMAGIRWVDGCPDAPCDGLDRTELLTAATRYGPRAKALATAWQVIVLKDALDTMDVGSDTVMFPIAARQLVDGLHGTGAGPFDASLLMRAQPVPATWLSLARGTGGDDNVVDWGSARNRLAAHVVSVVDQALIEAHNAPLKPLLERVRERAAR